MALSTSPLPSPAPCGLATGQEMLISYIMRPHSLAFSSMPCPTSPAHQPCPCPWLTFSAIFLVLVIK